MIAWLAACLLVTATPPVASEAPSPTLDDYRQALALARDLGHAPAEAEARYGLAVTSRALGQADASRRHGQQALTLYETLGDVVGAAATHDLLGALEAESGRLLNAEESFTRALELRRLAGDRAGEATSLHNLASCALDRGDAAGALENLDQALHLHRKQGDQPAEAAALNNLGLLWLHLGRYGHARRHLTQAAALYRSQADEPGLASTSSNLGLLAHAEERFEDAAVQARRALDIAGRLGDKPLEAAARGNLGLARVEQGRWQEARRQLEAAIELAERHGLARIAASHLGSLGRLELRRGHLRPDLLGDAAERLSRASDELAALEAPRAHSATLFDLAEALRLQGETQPALEQINLAIALLEDLRSPLAGTRHDSQTLAHAFAAERPFYDLRVDLLVELDRPKEALLAAETARARGLLRLLRPAGQAPSVALEAQDSSPGRFTDELEALLEPRTKVLVYHLGERSAWAFSITTPDDALPSAATRGLEVDIQALGASSQIEALAIEAAEKLSQSHRRAFRGPARQAAVELARRLLPDGDALEGVDRLVIVPDGGLHRVPFAALLGHAGQPLDARFEIVQVPSLTVLAALRRRPPPRDQSIAILADPVFDAADPRLPASPASPAAHRPGEPSFKRLAWSGVEAERIATLFPEERVELRLGLEADEDALLGGELSGFSRLHFATHALIDDAEPERSGLAFAAYSTELEAKRGFVELADLFELRLDADLVTLSACRSALGQSLRGEGLLGLSHGFFAAGARRLVLSLWDVDDRATSELMQHFYGALVAGKKPAAALAAARREMRQDARWRAPFYWAGFVLIGDWR